MIEVFEGHDEEIALKKPFMGKLDIDIDYSWDEHMRMIDTHRRKHVDRNPDKMRIGLNGFHDRDDSPAFAIEIIEYMQDTFMVAPSAITNIAFAGFGPNSGSYPWHKDSMDVLLLQIQNKIQLRVEGINNDEPMWFGPGEFVWLPRGTHHQIIPHGSRITFSFGVETKGDPSIMF